MPRATPDNTTHTPDTAPDITAPSRRRIFAGLSATLLAGAAIATAARGATVAAGDDAGLIRLCAEFHRLHAATKATPRHDDAAMEQALDKRWEVSDEIQHTSATTMAGHRAKASVAIVLLRENNGGDTFTSGDKAFAFAALLDLTGDLRSAIGVAATSNPDAELIAACNAFDTLERQFCSHCRGGDNYIADDDERDEVVAPILAQQEALLERICATRAVTNEGIRAKARSLVLWEPDLLVAEKPFWDVQITASILHDLAGNAAV